MKVAVAGYGVEGKASVAYWRSLGHEVVIADERDELFDVPEGVGTILGATAFATLGDFDVIVRSPGVRPAKLPYGEKVWSATNEFFAECSAPIIGVTGTKGKGTTSSFIASILRASGKTVHLVGNIGQPALEVLPTVKPTDVVVFELSSFQLWDAKQSPHVAVVLMIEPDHLEVHTDMNDYVSAKANIVMHQTPEDVVVYNSQNDYSRAIAARSAAHEQRSYPYDAGNLLDAVVLPGQHNRDNASAAILAVRDYVTDDDTIRAGLAAFTGLPHRLKFVATKQEVSYYDDSIATTPGSAIAAMRSFTVPKVLILGGSDKGADYREVVEVAAETSTSVVAIGQTGEKIMLLCQEIGVTAERELGLMPDAVRRAAALAQPGGAVMLSPASASFDQYKNYADRGDQFVAAVGEL